MPAGVLPNRTGPSAPLSKGTLPLLGQSQSGHLRSRISLELPCASLPAELPSMGLAGFLT